jgi:3-oxoacyl-[acyl-carrier-protein] synthase II
MKRVVVTGIGTVNPLGNSLGESWKTVKSGASGIAPVTRFDSSGTRWKIAGELKGFNPLSCLSRKEILRLDPFIHYAVASSMMAAEDAGFCLEDIHSAEGEDHPGDGTSGGVIIGSSRGGISTFEKEIMKKYAGQDRAQRISAYLMPATTISMASSYVAQKLAIRGYCLGISNACSSGMNAIGEAYRLLRDGHLKYVFCGGAEAPVCKVCAEGYGESGALSKRNDPGASMPFDRRRDGFVLAEGACILILEEYEHALQRGARIYGEVIGYGNTADAFHQTVPSEHGEARAVSLAIADAGLSPRDIDFISAHATSTPRGDRTETAAIKRALGARAFSIPVSGLKSMTGHMLAASGALESAFTLLSMREGVLFPTMNLSEKDPECDLDYVTELRTHPVEYALAHSFGFGGVNAVLVFRRTGK